MLTICNNCKYFVHQEDQSCFNCGGLNPAGNPVWSNISFKRIGLIMIVLSSLISLIVFTTQGFTLSALASAFLVSFVLTFMVEGILSNLNKITPNSLIDKQSVISERLEELKARNIKVIKVLNKITETDNATLQGVKTKLLTAKEIIGNQTERYELQQRKIDLIRVQNHISPFIFDFEKLNDVKIDDGLGAIGKARSQVKTLNKMVNEQSLKELSAQNLPERDEFLEQLAETETSYSKLRESLISKQATNALKDITDFGAISSKTNELELAVETFNANAEISNFSESFEELEAEYKRLRSENDISDKLLT